ncbi:MAG: inositol 2-dehydrogenase [Acetivibrionales bacterium]|jgi:myo-inositol 2-dehydrogenase/D-chiro-inositol 1-dehydrogenase
MESKFNIGIIGAGRIGKLHAENITFNVPQVKIKSIADVCMNDEMEKWAKQLGISCVTKDAEEIINDKEIEAVLICSSTNTHAQFISECAQAGKHIFCEKPIDFDLAKIKEALEAVEKGGVKLQLGFVRRFDHNHKKVRDTVAKGLIGEPHIVKITSRDPEPPPIDYVRVSGGLFMDMMIHDFDMARYLSGSEVEEVFAMGDVLIEPAIGKEGDVDTAIVTMRFQNGALGVIDNSRKATYGYDQRTEVHGSKGCVFVLNDVPNTSVISTEEGVFCEKPPWFFLERYNDAFITEIKEFFQAVINDTQTPVTGIDGLVSTQIALAAKKSLKEKRPVRLSEITF